MITTCKKCNISFKLNDSLIKATGSKVRCSKCRNIYVVYPLASEKVAEDAQAPKEPEELSLELDTGAELEAEEKPEEGQAEPELQDIESFDLEDLKIEPDGQEEAEPIEDTNKKPMESIELDGLGGLDISEMDEVVESKDEEKESPSEEQVARVTEEEPKAAVYKEPLPDEDTAEGAKTPSKDLKTEKDKQIDRKKKASENSPKRISTQILIFFIIVLIGGGVFAIYTLLGPMGPKQLKTTIGGLNIPYVSKYFKPEVPDPGNLKMTTFNIDSKFLDNSKGQKLFVISGKVRNEYSEPRSFIRITGKLFSKGNILKRAAKVYCGNILSEQELMNLSSNEIKNRLSNRSGGNNSNVSVKPNQAVSFMLVFGNLPTNLEEFSIEVEGSSKG